MPASNTEETYFPKPLSRQAFMHDGKTYDLVTRVRDTDLKLTIPDGTRQVAFTRLGFSSMDPSDPVSRSYGSVVFNVPGGRPPKVTQLSRDAFELAFENYRDSGRGTPR